MKRWIIALSSLFFICPVMANDLASCFKNPPEAASPWVFWYWADGAVSREGITADLEAMKEIGIAGVYLFTVRDAGNPPLFDPPARQLTPHWWDLVCHAMQEADRLGLKMGLHACDGFSLAGGPWITPEKSMQKLVWTTTLVEGGQVIDQMLPQPETRENYYRDVALLAFPSPEGTGISTRTVVPQVTTDMANLDPQFLVDPDNRKQRLRSSTPCWIQYRFDQSFTCRSIKIRKGGNNTFQALRLRVEASDDGQSFQLIEPLEPPRHGWQDSDADYTYAIKATTARCFRFVYDPDGTEPGSEDLDSAKWKASLDLRGIELFTRAQIHQFEGKSGAVWRMSPSTTSEQIPESLCVPRGAIREISSQMDSQGRLHWDAPPGQWTLLRMGTTSTGHQNDLGGAAKGLECDKFNPEVVAFQFDQWFGEFIRKMGPDLASRVLKIFHTDSWETGSQNWSPVFREAFKQRRGYDLGPWLPAMAGIPVESAEASERFLLDVRTTIAELIDEVFFGTMIQLAHEQGCQYSSENVAPTMVSDNLRHFGIVDIPMGEFWLRSPSHDKPNDMRDAVSGAHIYGKPIVQAEAFTEIHFAWDEHPALLKALGDRNYALGVNRFVYHVWTQNPWLDRQPGIGLGITGLFFQRDQTWIKPGRAWVDYHKRCQALLQVGRPEVDMVVFAGDDLPSRGVLPERLIPTLPGLFGAEAIQREKQRLANVGQPMQRVPKNITSTANATDPVDWIDPLRGYTYDSINADGLLHQAKIKNGALEMPGGICYRVLVVPGPRPMSPNAIITPATQKRIQEIIAAGVPVITAAATPGAIRAPYRQENFSSLGIEPDVRVEGGGIAWTHRTSPDADIYFIANQQECLRTLELSLRVTGRVPELWNPVDGEMQVAQQWHIKDGRTCLPVQLAANGSVFVVLRQATSETQRNAGLNWIETTETLALEGPWSVTFGTDTVVFDELSDWSTHSNPAIQSFSGTALYQKSFEGSQLPSDQRIWLDLGTVHNLAQVTLNGKVCATTWTPPYRVDITDALRSGTNELAIEVTNTWANRLIGDRKLPEDQRTSWSLRPQMAGTEYRSAGLLGPISINWR